MKRDLPKLWSGSFSAKARYANSQLSGDPGAKTTVDAPAPYHGYRKFIFSYDSWGNLVSAAYPGGQGTRLTIQYDYKKPVMGMIDNFQVTSSLKLLQYLELIRLPMHHAIVMTNFEVGYSTYFSEIHRSTYKNYIISNGLVQSYVYDDPYRPVTFYNGWDCGSSSASNPDNAIANLKEFQEVYSNQQ